MIISLNEKNTYSPPFEASSLLHNITLEKVIYTLFNFVFEIALFFGVVDYFLMQYFYYFFWVGTRAARYIACDCRAHLVSKAGSVIINKSPSTVFKWSGI